MFGVDFATRRRSASSTRSGLYLGIDFGAYSLKACRVVQTKQGLRLQQVRVCPYSSPLSANDPMGSLERIQEAIQVSGLVGSRWRPIPIACTLPSCMTQMRLLDAPADQEADQEEMILRELSAEGNDSEEEWLGDYWATDSSASTEVDSPIGIVGARRNWIEQLISRFEALGLEPRVIDGSPFTIARAMRRERGDCELQAALDIGYEGALFVFVRRGLPKYFRVLRGCGIRGVVEAIRNGLSISEKDSHQFLKACSQASRRPSADSKAVLSTLRDLTAMPLRRLQNEIAKTLDFTRRQGIGGDLKRVTLLGGGALFPGISPLLEGWTDLDFRPWNAALDELSETHVDLLPLMSQAIALAEIESHG